MKIKKRLHGDVIDIEVEKIKDYGKYSLYQVYKIENGKRIPLYKETYTDDELEEIHKNKNIISEEMYELWKCVKIVVDTRFVIDVVALLVTVSIG